MIPVIAIDGPAGAGKGTIAKKLAADLGWHYLDSGAIYRVMAYAATQSQIDLADEAALVEMIEASNVVFQDDQVLLSGEDVSEFIRLPANSDATSKIAVLPQIRNALMARQKAFRQAPGLVAEGRDMATVVFPDADFKLYLTASVHARAQRRHKQLSDKGFSATLAALISQIAERDERDSSRAVAPLRPAEGALVIDCSEMNPAEVLALTHENLPNHLRVAQ